MQRINMCCYLLVTLVFTLYSHAISSKDLKASIAYIPHLAESAEKGPFIELTKAINSQYTQGDIEINVYPMARSLNNLITGKVDFHLPMINSPYININDLPYRFATEPMGTVCFVIYSHKSKALTKEDILNVKSKTPYPYYIETLRGMPNILNLPFPVYETSTLKSSLRNILKHRVDALIFAQEEVDYLIKKHEFHNIHRAIFDCWDDVIVIPKGKKGDEIDKILSTALKELDSSGKLKQLRKNIHVPYIEWQP